MHTPNNWSFFGHGGSMILWWLLIIVALAAMLWFLKKNSVSNPQSETPLSILKKRYARGEISKEEFEEMKKELM